MLHGWAGSIMPVDQQTSQDCFFDLVDFAKRQWNEQYHNIKGPEYSFEEEATASDVAEFPLARSSRTGTGEGREGYRRNFDPINRPGKGKGYGQQRPGSVGSTATSPFSAAVAGLGDKTEVLRDPIQAARESRPIGDVGTGDRAIRAKDGQMIGGDQQQAPLLHRLSQLSLRLRLHQCLTQGPTRHQTLQQKPRAQLRQRKDHRDCACHSWSAKSTARSMACRTSSAPSMTAR